MALGKYEVPPARVTRPKVALDDGPEKLEPQRLSRIAHAVKLQIAVDVSIAESDSASWGSYRTDSIGHLRCWNCCTLPVDLAAFADPLEASGKTIGSETRRYHCGVLVSFTHPAQAKICPKCR
ncbi:hypothetical protein A6768_11355 [Sphingobium yanoikuyae]|uniref:Uncharacterized protein n=1 Tax=Sphingobium yanoikuyae TaxID=13690 RepID=A0A291N047_SPHYA|nr:hypothetical protein A6768_11355 [Sphingobium yanoikuyae]